MMTPDSELLEQTTAVALVVPSSEALGWWDVWVPTDGTGGIDHGAYWATLPEHDLDELHERGEVEIMNSTGTALWGDE